MEAALAVHHVVNAEGANAMPCMLEAGAVLPCHDSSHQQAFALLVCKTTTTRQVSKRSVIVERQCTLQAVSESVVSFKSRHYLMPRQLMCVFSSATSIFESRCCCSTISENSLLLCRRDSGVRRPTDRSVHSRLIAELLRAHGMRPLWTLAPE